MRLIFLPTPVTSSTCSTDIPVAADSVDSPPDDYIEYHEEDDSAMTPTVSAHTRRKELSRVMAGLT